MRLYLAPLSFGFRFILLLNAIAMYACQKTSKSQVLIYYANETSLDSEGQENYRILESWLTADPSNKQAVKIARQLQSDLKVFPQSVLEEIDQIRSTFTRLDKPTDLEAVVIFTNKLSHKKKFSSISNKYGYLEHRFEISSVDNPVINTSPLASPHNLELALQRASELYSPQSYDFVLVTKSHGNKEMALVPRVAIDSQKSSKEDVLKIVNGDANDDGRMPEWILTSGTSKTRYFDVLQKASDQHDIEFAMVYVEACNSQGGLAQLGPLPPAIRVIAAPNVELDYRVIPYDKLLNNLVGKNQTFAEALLQETEQRFPGSSAQRQEIKQSIAQRLISSAIYFIPLLVIAMLLAWYRRK